LGEMASSPHVLCSTEVLQDGEFLYSVMPFCSGGDLFGVVVQHAEESGGEGGMSEPVARYWFRQILLVSSCHVPRGERDCFTALLPKLTIYLLGSDASSSAGCLSSRFVA
jgi:serine/threonine protein kinase